MRPVNLMESGIDERSARGIATGRPIAVEEVDIGTFGAPTGVVALALGAFAVMASVVGLLFVVVEGVGVASLLVGAGAMMAELEDFKGVVGAA